MTEKWAVWNNFRVGVFRAVMDCFLIFKCLWIVVLRVYLDRITVGYVVCQYKKCSVHCVNLSWNGKRNFDVGRMKHFLRNFNIYILTWFHRKMQKNLENTHQEIGQYTMSDNIELLEDFNVYANLRNGPVNGPITYEMTLDTFKNPRIRRHLKVAFFDCIHHHEHIMEMASRYEGLMNFFLLFKLADINTLLTLILFAIVSLYTAFLCKSCDFKTSFSRQLPKTLLVQLSFVSTWPFRR